MSRRAKSHKNHTAPCLDKLRIQKADNLSDLLESVEREGKNITNLEQKTT